MGITAHIFRQSLLEVIQPVECFFLHTSGQSQACMLDLLVLETEICGGREVLKLFEKQHHGPYAALSPWCRVTMDQTPDS